MQTLSLMPPPPPESEAELEPATEPRMHRSEGFFSPFAFVVTQGLVPWTCAGSTLRVGQVVVSLAAHVSRIHAMAVVRGILVIGGEGSNSSSSSGGGGGSGGGSGSGVLCFCTADAKMRSIDTRAVQTPYPPVRFVTSSNRHHLVVCFAVPNNDAVSEHAVRADTLPLLAPNGLGTYSTQTLPRFCAHTVVADVACRGAYGHPDRPPAVLQFTNPPYDDLVPSRSASAASAASLAPALFHVDARTIPVFSQHPHRRSILDAKFVDDKGTRVAYAFVGDPTLFIAGINIPPRASSARGSSAAAGLGSLEGIRALPLRAVPRELAALGDTGHIAILDDQNHIHVWQTAPPNQGGPGGEASSAAIVLCHHTKLCPAYCPNPTDMNFLLAPHRLCFRANQYVVLLDWPSSET